MSINSIWGLNNHASTHAPGGRDPITRPQVVAPVVTTPTTLTSATPDGTLIAVDTTAENFVLNLESSPAQNRYLRVKNTGTGGYTLTIGRGGNLIDQVAEDLVLSDQSAVDLVWDDTQKWMVL